VSETFSLSPGPGPDVGDFRQGSPGSRWALTRFLVGRAVLTDLDRLLSWLGFGLLAVGALSWWVVSPWLGVPLILISLAVLGVRAIATALVRGLFGAGRRASDPRLAGLIKATRADVHRELRRLGLPGRVATMPLLALRLVGRRRIETVRRLSQFRAENVVPPDRVDELHMVLHLS